MIFQGSLIVMIGHLGCSWWLDLIDAPLVGDSRVGVAVTAAGWAGQAQCGRATGAKRA